MGPVGAMCWGAIGYCVAVWLSDAWENRLRRKPSGNRKQEEGCHAVERGEIEIEAGASQAGSEGQQSRRAVHGSFLSGG